MSSYCRINHIFFLQIPVFRGCASPLVGAINLCSDHFGTDGFGDVIKDRDPRWEEKIQKENAVNAMIRLVTENQNQVKERSAERCASAIRCGLSERSFCRSPWWPSAHSLTWPWPSD